MEALDPAAVLRQLRWRYAVKKFDPSRRIPPTHWDTLKQAVQLAPSSFGLQPWLFAVVTDPAVKADLVPAAWGQGQVRDCSHLVALAARESVDGPYVDKFLRKVAADRGVEVGSLTGYRDVIVRFVEKMDEREMRAWNANQVYLALGQLLAAAAMLGVDACPMEGIDADAFDKCLRLEGSGYRTQVVCALGYRDPSDRSAAAPKVRFDEPDIFRFIGE